MVGIPGSGKTLFAEKFSETFHAPCINYEKIASLVGPDVTKGIALYQLSELLKTRQSIVIDGAADTKAERAEITKHARAAGYEPLFIWVQTDPQTAKSRALKARKKQGYTLEDYKKAEERFAAPSSSEQPVVISGKHTYATQAKAVLKRLSAPRAEIAVSSRPAAREQASQPKPVPQTPSTHTQSPRRNITIR